MKVVEPYARLVDVPDRAAGIALLRRIERAARASHHSEDRQTDDSWELFTGKVVVSDGHWSVAEHATATVDFLVDRGVTHELVRHRIGPYNLVPALTQESTRYVNYALRQPPQWIYPIPGVTCRYCMEGKEPLQYGGDAWIHSLSSDSSVPTVVECAYVPTWLSAIQRAERYYCELVQKGWDAEQARSVLPHALAARLVATYNLRTWRHIFVMRCSDAAHRQMRQVMGPLLTVFKERIPLLYDDIHVGAPARELMHLVG
jgi:thymidylate synthase (FAD)